MARDLWRAGAALRRYEVAVVVAERIEPDQGNVVVGRRDAPLAIGLTQQAPSRLQPCVRQSILGRSIAYLSGKGARQWRPGQNDCRTRKRTCGGESHWPHRLSNEGGGEISHSGGALRPCARRRFRSSRDARGRLLSAARTGGQASRPRPICEWVANRLSVRTAAVHIHVRTCTKDARDPPFDAALLPPDGMLSAALRRGLRE